jgi:hypothetical protein
MRFVCIVFAGFVIWCTACRVSAAMQHSNSCATLLVVKLQAVIVAGCQSHSGDKTSIDYLCVARNRSAFTLKEAAAVRAPLKRSNITLALRQ